MTGLRRRGRRNKRFHVDGIVPPHVQKTQDLASGHRSDDESGRNKNFRSGRRPQRSGANGGGGVRTIGYESDVSYGSFQQPPSYNIPAHEHSSVERDKSYRERFGKGSKSNHSVPSRFTAYSDSGNNSLDSFAVESLGRPPQNVHCDSSTYHASEDDSSSSGSDNDSEVDDIDYGYNDYSNPTPSSNSKMQYQTTTSLGSTRNHALSYGGSTDFEDFHSGNHSSVHDSDDYDYMDREQTPPAYRQNGSRNFSVSISDHLQLRSKGSTDEDSSYFNDDEFSLTGVENDSKHVANHPQIPVVDAVDYRDASRHQKDLASLGHRTLERITQKPGSNPIDELFKVVPDHAYKDTFMTRRQLRKEVNAKSAYYHDLRLQSQQKLELGQLRVEILQCFGLPTTSLVRQVSAYGVAVHGNAAFQTDVVPNVANPMWLSKMRRACVFPVQTMYSQLYIGIFDLETLVADPDTIIGHPGHPGWIPPEQRGGGFHRGSMGHSRSGSMGHNRSGSMGHNNRSGSMGSSHRSGSMGHASVDSDTGEIRTSIGHGSKSNINGGEANDCEDDNDFPPPIEYCTEAEDFIGHVAIDLCRLRPGTTYDVTLPLRRSKHVFAREPHGSVRLRLHLVWNAEQKAVMSYLPKSMGGTVDMTRQPNMRFTVNCVDDRAARNVAHTIHGVHMPGKFDLTLVKSTIREIHWTRVHVFRYCRKREIYNLTYWVYPSISCFVFGAWMHSIYFGTLRYIPGHVVVFLLLHLIKNYAYYAMDSPLQNGFYAPTLEELYWALIRGTKKRKKQYIEPMTIERDSSAYHDIDLSATLNGGERKTMDELYDENGNLVHVSRFPLSEIADAMKKSMRVNQYRKGFTVFKHTFQGDDAVDFLVNNGFAMTRPEAVSLGRRLEREKYLFEHITREVYFEDSPYVYTFLDCDSEQFIVKKGHIPRGGRLLELLGFYSRKSSGKSDRGKSGTKVTSGADILESREHVEFPFATGVDHPRFTIKESLVIRSPEEKQKIAKENQAKAMIEVAEFGIAPNPINVSQSSLPNHARSNSLVTGYESESGTKTTGNSRGSLRNTSKKPEEGPMTGANFVRRGSLLVGNAVVNAATGVAIGVAEGANFMTGGLAGTIIRGRNNNAHFHSTDALLEVATGEQMYRKLRDQNNAELDRALDLQRKADEYDPYDYDSDNDVGTIQKKKRKKYVIHEKHLKRPMSQEVGIMSPHMDMSLGKALEKSKRELNKFFNHMFDDQVYKIDKHLFPTRFDAKTEKEIKKKKKLGLFNRKATKEELKLEEERQKQMPITPYDKQKEEMDKLLLINEHSHSNPWINRVAVVMQPLLEMTQTVLFAFRAGFNVFTWQDPVLGFWLCFLGPPLAIILYIFPYRIIGFLLCVYWMGPQNYIIRLYRESRPGYEPPNFDLIVKNKKIEKAENFQEMQFFSSEAPGNQQIQFRNIDPLQVKQIVVPSNVLMYNRFYDWPPEPEYARVYASPAPKNLISPSFVGEADGYESESTYVFDQAARDNPNAGKKKKKKKTGFKIVTSRIKKGTRATFGGVEQVGGAVLAGTEQVFGSTAEATVGAMKGTAKLTKNVVKGTGKQAKSAAKGTGNFLRLRKKKYRDYSESDDDYY